MNSTRIKTRINIHMDDFGEHARDVLREVYETQGNHDVIIMSGKRQIRCHRLVLSFCSDFLKAILEEPTYGHITPIISIPDVAEDILEQILDFMYTGEIRVMEDRFNEFLDVCTALQLKSMNNCKTADFIKSDTMMVEEQEPERDEETQMEVQEALLETDEGVHKVQIIADPEYTEYQIVSQKDAEATSYEIELIQDTGNTETYNDTTPTQKRTKRTVKRERVKDEFDGAAGEQIKNAVDEIIHDKISFQQAAEKYNVSKTLLWRLCQTSPEYHMNRSATNNPELNQIIIDALKGGETLMSISKKYNVPVSTLHRRKSLLYEQGELPENVRIKQRNRGDNFNERLAKAINDVVTMGVSQTEASKKYQIPKTTIWRRIKKVDPKFQHLVKTEDADPGTEPGKWKKEMDESYTFTTSGEEIIIGDPMNPEEVSDEPQVKYMKYTGEEEEEEIREQSGTETS